MIKNSGFINILKPTGMTSADVVFAVKKKLKIKKIGHLGTLDPAATGVLPIAIGKACKFFNYFLNKDKVYVARVKFGIETDTLDSYGNITQKSNKIISKEEILNVIPNFLGKINQIPPKYSAIKINGKRACDLARENVDFEIKPKQIEIFDITLLQQCGENEFLFRVHCSAGTYIRTLFSDMAYALNSMSTTTAILREKSGRFGIETAIIIDELDENSVMSVEKAFSGSQVIEPSEIVAKKLINGVKIFAKELEVLPESEFFVKFNGILVGFYKVVGENVEPIVYLGDLSDD